MNAEQAKTLTREDFHRHAAALRPETRMLIDAACADLEEKQEPRVASTAEAKKGNGMS